MTCSCGVKGLPRKKRCSKVKKRITKSCSAKAFRENIRECVCRTGKPRAQCVAIAYAVKRKACKKARRRSSR